MRRSCCQPNPLQELEPLPEDDVLGREPHLVGPYALRLFAQVHTRLADVVRVEEVRARLALLILPRLGSHLLRSDAGCVDEAIDDVLSISGKVNDEYL